MRCHFYKIRVLFLSILRAIYCLSYLYCFHDSTLMHCLSSCENVAMKWNPCSVHFCQFISAIKIINTCSDPSWFCAIEISFFPSRKDVMQLAKMNFSQWFKLKVLLVILPMTNVYVISFICWKSITKYMYKE